MTTLIKGKEYDLATSLRVAYLVQGQHNHKPYSEIFQSMGEMGIEEQIGVLYASFKVANPEACKVITQNVFLDEYLDNYNLKQIMDQLEEVIHGIMGFDDADLNEGVVVDGADRPEK